MFQRVSGAYVGMSRGFWIVFNVSEGFRGSSVAFQERFGRFMGCNDVLGVLGVSGAIQRISKSIKGISRGFWMFKECPGAFQVVAVVFQGHSMVS